MLKLALNLNLKLKFKFKTWKKLIEAITVCILDVKVQWLKSKSLIKEHREIVLMTKFLVVFSRNVFLGYTMYCGEP